MKIVKLWVMISSVVCKALQPSVIGSRYLSNVFVFFIVFFQPFIYEKIVIFPNLEKMKLYPHNLRSEEADSNICWGYSSGTNKTEVLLLQI